MARDAATAADRIDETPQFGQRLAPEEIEAISDAIGTDSWAGFIGKLVVALTPFCAGVQILRPGGSRARGLLSRWSEVTGYDDAVGVGLVVLGVVLGWWLLRTRRPPDAG